MGALPAQRHVASAATGTICYFYVNGTCVSDNNCSLYLNGGCTDQNVWIVICVVKGGSNCPSDPWSSLTLIWNNQPLCVPGASVGNGGLSGNGKTGNGGINCRTIICDPVTGICTSL